MRVEGALEELRELGVYVTIDEFKGRVPIRRGGLELRPRASDFDNPLLTRHYESRTGGSRGPRTRLVIDLDLLVYEAAQFNLFLSEFGLTGAPVAMWRELPPGVVGIKNWLRYAKLGKNIEKWFAQRKNLAHLEDFKFHAFTVLSRILGGLRGRPVPRPERVAFDEADRVARWLAGKRSDGMPAIMDTTPSTGIRICLAARQAGLDISGSFFRFSAEPYTLAKSHIIQDAGCRAASFYSASEIGHIGLACSHPEHPDEVHLMTDKLAMIRRRRPVGTGAWSVDAFLFTTVLTSCPKIMLNVELGDYGIVSRRNCGCLLDRLGFDLHLHEIRSFEKLTSGGATFLGTDLIALLEEELPARFGGTPLDYQFVEEERNAVSVVCLRISPRLGPMDEEAVRDCVLSKLGTVHAGRLMADGWRAGNTLNVVRKEPLATGSLKLLPLHLLKT